MRLRFTALLCVALAAGSTASEASEDGTCTPEQYDACIMASSSGQINLLVAQINGILEGYISDMVDRFNTQNPTRNVTPHFVPFGSAFDEALADLRDGVNFYHGYVMPVGQRIAEMNPFLEDLTSRVVNDVNSVSWETIGSFFRSHQAVWNGAVYLLPIDGDFHSLYYRIDVFAERNLSVPKTLQEYVQVAQRLQGEDLNGDGVPDFGSCISHLGFTQQYYFWSLAAPYLQLEGTRQGVFFDVDRGMEPLIDNEAMHEVIRLWKEIPGPPAPVDGTPRGDNSTLSYFLEGRCAMAIEWSEPFKDSHPSPTAFPIDGKVGVATAPGSENVWDRSRQAMVPCDIQLCPYAQRTDDGRLINVAPNNAFTGFSGAVNTAGDLSHVTTAYNFLSFLLQPEQRAVAIFRPGTGLAPVRESELAVEPYVEAGYPEVSASMYSEVESANIQAPNAVLELKVTDTASYLDVANDVLTRYFEGSDVYAELSLDTGAEEAAREIASRWDGITQARGAEALEVEYRMGLGTYVSPPPPPLPGKTGVDDEVLFIVLASIGSAAALLSLCCCCFFSVRRIRVYRRMVKAHETKLTANVHEALETTRVLEFPAMLVPLKTFVAMGHLRSHEGLRAMSGLQVCDTLEELRSLAHTATIIFISHQWIGHRHPDPHKVQYEVMVSAVKQIVEETHRDENLVYIWCDFCSIPQRCKGVQQLAINSLPLYASTADTFLIVAPTTPHEDFEHIVCDATSYQSRMWCRAEQLCYRLRNGLTNVWIATSPGDCVRVSDGFSQSSLLVFQGEATNDLDRFKLVQPILGLYGELYASANPADGSLQLLTLLQSRKAELFPPTWTFEHKTESTTADRIGGPLPRAVRLVRDIASKTSGQPTVGVDETLGTFSSAGTRKLLRRRWSAQRQAYMIEAELFGDMLSRVEREVDEDHHLKAILRQRKGSLKASHWSSDGVELPPAPEQPPAAQGNIRRATLAPFTSAANTVLTSNLFGFIRPSSTFEGSITRNSRATHGTHMSQSEASPGVTASGYKGSHFGASHFGASHTSNLAADSSVSRCAAEALPEEAGGAAA